jgi:hypothetical protein
VDPLGLSERKPRDCANGDRIFAQKKAEIEAQIAIHDYTDPEHRNANPQIPGGVSGAVANERATGLPTGGSWHTQKAVQIRDSLKKILKQSDNAYDMSPCQKAALRALAEPYIQKINAALATPLAPRQ